MLKVNVTKADATLVQEETLTSGRVGIQIQFDFSSDWTGLGVEAIFVCGSDKYKKVLTLSDLSATCEVPNEVLDTARQYLNVGLYGVKTETVESVTTTTVVIPTVWCGLGLIEQGTDPTDANNSVAVTATDKQQMLDAAQEATDAAEEAEENIIRQAAATVDSTTGIPSVTATLSAISASDPTQGKKLTLAFEHLKGAKGDKGDKGDAGTSGTWGSITGTLSNQTDLQTALDAKQATLVSGTNIKTINSTSLLGSGNIDATSYFDVTFTVDAETEETTADKTNAEIYAAYTSGKIVRGLYESLVLTLVYCTNSQSIFSLVSKVNGGADACTVVILNNLCTEISGTLQDKLVSGTNIKTINGNSILGAGNLSIVSGVSSVNGKSGTVVLDGSDINVDNTAATTTTIKASITAIDTDLTEAQADIAELQDDVDDLETTVSTHSSNIVSLQNDKYDSTNLFFVNAQSNNSSFGNVVGTNVYKKDTSCTVTATAKVGYSFVKWIDTNTSAQVSTNATYTFTVTANKNLTAIFKDENLEIVSWASGTDAQICAMIQASDEGLIDLHDYWSVGDTRTVTLSAMAEDTSLGYEAHASQSVELVLMDTTCTGITLTSTGTAPSFIVGQKDGLLETGQMNSLNTNVGGWGATKRRGWCNDVYKVAIPSTLRSIFKQFTWQYVTSGTDGTLLTASDYFALAPEKAIFGSATHSRSEEAALFNQWAYYALGQSYRVKHIGASGSASIWWECSPRSGNSTNFCYVNSNGSADHGYATNSRLLAPFGCI